MAILRQVRKHHFVALPNAMVCDATLTWEARGVLAYLLSKPQDWKVRAGDLIKRGPGGRERMFRIFKELREHGYMKREATRKPDGTYEWEISVYDEPQPKVEKTDSANPTSAKPTIQKKDSTKTESTNSGAFAPNARMAKIVEWWNAMADRYKLPRVERVTAGLQGLAMQRHRSVGTDEAFFAAIERITKSPFLLGKGDIAFKASFAWFVTEGNFDRLVNGFYDGMGSAPKKAAEKPKAKFHRAEFTT